MWPCASSVHDSTFGERGLCQKSQWKIDKRVMCVTHYIQCISSYADSSFHTDLKANRFDSIETQVDHSQTTVRWELTKPSCNYRMYHPAIKKINDVTYFVSNSEGNHFEKNLTATSWASSVLKRRRYCCLMEPRSVSQCETTSRIKSRSRVPSPAVLARRQVAKYAYRLLAHCTIWHEKSQTNNQQNFGLVCILRTVSKVNLK